jgi:hypothetical protein
MSDNLGDFIKNSSSWVSKEDFAPGYVIAKFLGYSIYPKTYKGKTLDTVGYRLILRGEEKEKTMESSSIKLAAKMNKVPVGSIIKIEKSGEGFNTEWKVVLGQTSQPTPQQQFEQELHQPITTEQLVDEFGGKILEDESKDDDIKVENIPF